MNVVAREFGLRQFARHQHRASDAVHFLGMPEAWSVVKMKSFSSISITYRRCDRYGQQYHVVERHALLAVACRVSS